MNLATVRLSMLDLIETTKHKPLILLGVDIATGYRTFTNSFFRQKIHTAEAGSEAISALTAKGRVGVSALSLAGGIAATSPDASSAWLVRFHQSPQGLGLANNRPAILQFYDALTLPLAQAAIHFFTGPASHLG